MTREAKIAGGAGEGQGAVACQLLDVEGKQKPPEARPLDQSASPTRWIAISDGKCSCARSGMESKIVSRVDEAGKESSAKALGIKATEFTLTFALTSRESKAQDPMQLRLLVGGCGRRVHRNRNTSQHHHWHQRSFEILDIHRLRNASPHRAM